MAKFKFRFVKQFSPLRSRVIERVFLNKTLIGTSFINDLSIAPTLTTRKEGFRVLFIPLAKWKISASEDNAPTLSKALALRQILADETVTLVAGRISTTDLRTSTKTKSKRRFSFSRPRFLRGRSPKQRDFDRS